MWWTWFLLLTIRGALHQMPTERTPRRNGILSKISFRTLCVALLLKSDNWPPASQPSPSVSWSKCSNDVSVLFRTMERNVNYNQIQLWPVSSLHPARLVIHMSSRAEIDQANFMWTDVLSFPVLQRIEYVQCVCSTYEERELLSQNLFERRTHFTIYPIKRVHVDILNWI